MGISILPLLNRLMRKRLLIWLLTLALILIFSGSLGAIFWNVRMKVSQPVEIFLEAAETQPRERLYRGGELFFLTSIPVLPFQLIRPGDGVSFSSNAELKVEGIIWEIERGERSVRLRVSVREIRGGEEAFTRLRGAAHSRETIAGTLTLRGVRLFAALSRQGRL